jgi:hypothetical protein
MASDVDPYCSTRSETSAEVGLFGVGNAVWSAPFETTSADFEAVWNIFKMRARQPRREMPLPGTRRP